MTPQLHKQIESAIAPMDGWCWLEKAVALADLIIETRPEVVVEIGVFGGRSLVPMAMAVRDNRRGCVFGIDPWRVDAAVEGDVGKANEEWWKTSVNLNDIYMKCIGHIRLNGLMSHCTILRTTSQEAVNLFQTIDILHLDGNHSELASCRDVNLYLPKIKPGGYLWFDDTTWQTTQKAIGLIKTQMTHVKDVVKEGVGACSLYQKPVTTATPAGS